MVYNDQRNDTKDAISSKKSWNTKIFYLHLDLLRNT